MSSKQLDPNHLALMTMATDVREQLRESIIIVKGLQADLVQEGDGELAEALESVLQRLRSSCDRVRLTLKGRIG